MRRRIWWAILGLTAVLGATGAVRARLPREDAQQEHRAWAKDAKPGDTTGQGVGNVWFVVQPGAQPAASNSGYGY